MNVLRRVLFLVIAIVIWSADTSAQGFVGSTWIDVSPTGETLICVVLESGQSYCQVQK